MGEIARVTRGHTLYVVKLLDSNNRCLKEDTV